MTSVGIVGAGIAGLVTAKVLKADGFDVSVFDKAGEIGGTWTADNTYPGLRTNNSKRTYEFFDHAYPDSAADHPTHEEVRTYLNSYADSFALRECIELGVEVTSIEQEGDGFVMALRNLGIEERRHFDRVVVCNGIFHCPAIPAFPGIDRFEGVIRHSREVDESTFAAGGALVVVGGGKSAYDIAEEAGRRGNDVTLAVRNPQWRAPRSGPEGIPGDYRMFARQMFELIPFFSDSDEAICAKQDLEASWIGLWNETSDQFAEVLAIPDALLPASKLPVGLTSLAASGDLFDLVRSGRVKVERSGIAAFEPHGLQMQSGKSIAADLVVCATGWQRDYAILSQDLSTRLFDDDGRLPLYRSLIPPAVEGLAFNGHASSFSCALSAEIGAHWLSELFLGRIELPAVAAMEADIARFREWADRWIPTRVCDGFIGPFHIPYALTLLRDIPGGSALIASFGDDLERPLLPAHFAPITDLRRSAREA